MEVEICDGIGSAEMFHIYITNRPGDVKPGSLGKIVEGYEAKIVDAESKEVATGEMGTLKVKGDSAALCYWNAHEKSKETFAGDWCTTGDQFHVDEEGYYWYHGRTDDMLKVSGIFVAPAEIENCLLQHPAVLECAVIGAEAGDGLIKPKAFVVVREEVLKPDRYGELNIRTGSSSDRVVGERKPDRQGGLDVSTDRSNDGADQGSSPTVRKGAAIQQDPRKAALAEELKEFVKSHLAPYKYPRWIEFLDELPKTATGKIQRFKLRA